MGFVKAYNLIRISAVAHMILGYILITAPQKIAKDTTIAILGEALGLQQANSSFASNPLASAIAGLLFIILGLSDFFAVGASEEVSRNFWGVQAPIRTLFFGAIVIYTYLMRPGRGKISPTSDDPLVNSVVFSWAFMEAIWWFWSYTNLREERNDAVARIMQRRQLKADMELRED